MSDVQIDQMHVSRDETTETASRFDNRNLNQTHGSVNTSPTASLGSSNNRNQALIVASSTRVPGTYPPKWLPDHETNSCMSCDSLFTLIKRRHHCRSCGKIYCAECCRQRVKLLYLNNKEARVCSSCFIAIERTLSEIGSLSTITRNESISSTLNNESSARPNGGIKIQGVLKTVSRTRSNSNECNISSSSSSTEQHSTKQVMFSDGVRPGTDLTDSFLCPVPSSSSSIEPAPSFPLLTRQNIVTQSRILIYGKKVLDSVESITVCDEMGYLPPIIINRDTSDTSLGSDSSSSMANLIASQFKSTEVKKTIQTSMESRNCPLNSIVNFEDISDLLGIEKVVTFILLKNFYLKVKLTKKNCCIDKNSYQSNPKTRSSSETNCSDTSEHQPPDQPDYWCFASDGLSRLGQNEIVLVIDKDKSDQCIPRDVFKIYLTLHELALRRQTLENLGNLLFQDGLFGNRNTAGLLFVRPLEEHCLKNLVIPSSNFLIALTLQRWEVPWSKIFPIRLMLRLGYRYSSYPYPVVSFRIRDPVFYEVGHTIISILGDFRNFRYSITYVDGLKVILNKASRRVFVHINESSYQQFNKVLDQSNNEHVLAWSCCPIPEADGHLISVQDEDGHYETVEFYKNSNCSSDQDIDILEANTVLGASFVIFSGALKVDQSGQTAKISVVEDGLLIQIQSCTLSALKNAIHYMHHFDIDCEGNQGAFDRVEIDWILQ